MLFTIDFDVKTSFSAVEVHHIGANWHLSFEPKAKLVLTNLTPKPFLTHGHITTEFSGSSKVLRIVGEGVFAHA